LIHGYLGAGKTTFAQQLTEDVGGIRLSLDDWYLRMYSDGEPTASMDPVLLDRVWAALDELWPQLLEQGVNVVLDFGYWTRIRRDRARDVAGAAGADTVLYSVACDEDVARARCLGRNHDPRSSFVIVAAAYDELKAGFEPLGEDEKFVAIDGT
jgi:predicted kinase